MTRAKLINSLWQIGVILAASLLVVAATYVVGLRLAVGFVPAVPGGSRGQGRLDSSAVATALSVPADEFEVAVGSPPDYEAASAELGMPLAEIEAAVEASGGSGRNRPDRSRFNIDNLATFAETLIPIISMVVVVAVFQSVWRRLRLN